METMQYQGRTLEVVGTPYSENGMQYIPVRERDTLVDSKRGEWSYLRYLLAVPESTEQTA